MGTTFSATIEHVEHTTSRATVRQHTALIDRMASKGGLDRGPIGGEYLLVSLGGCFTSHLLAAMRARDATVSGLRVTVTATMDGSPERFTSFTLAVSAECPDDQLARKLVMVGGRSCQVVNTLRPAAAITITYNGSPVELDDPSCVV
jgi:putative redox protein